MKTFDVFTHFMPPRYFKKFQEVAPDQGMFRRSMQVKPIWDLDARFRLMDEFSDYRQVISVGSPPIGTFAGPDLASELACIASNGMAAMGARQPEGFAGFCARSPIYNPDR